MAHAFTVVSALKSMMGFRPRARSPSCADGSALVVYNLVPDIRAQRSGNTVVSPANNADANGGMSLVGDVCHPSHQLEGKENHRA